MTYRKGDVYHGCIDGKVDNWKIVDLSFDDDGNTTVHVHPVKPKEYNPHKAMIVDTSKIGE